MLRKKWRTHRTMLRGKHFAISNLCARNFLSWCVERNNNRNNNRSLQRKKEKEMVRRRENVTGSSPLHLLNN